MTEEIEVSIDLHKVPEDVGYIGKFDGNYSLTIRSMRALRQWVNKKIPCAIGNTAKILFVVSGPMPNCVALQIGLLLAGKGEVIFETTRKIRRKMDVV